MTHEQFVQMANDTDAFKLLGKHVQDAILAAEGQARQEYVNLFLLARRLQEQNRIGFINKSMEIYNKFNMELKTKETAARQVVEVANTAEEEARNQLLLTNLNDEK